MSDVVSLTSCDQEPIHRPGSIQPHGVLLVADGRDLRVHHVAGDVEGLLGIGHGSADAAANGAGSVVGAPLAALLGEALAGRAAALLGAGLPGSFQGGFLGQLQAATGTLMDVALYPAGNDVLVELEPAAADAMPAAAVLDLVEEAAASFERAATVQAVCDRAANVFRRLTGFDRVMVYRFLEGGAGCVLAEARRDGLHSFLNHHFPASDIPQQARALYLRNLTRVIPDAGYRPAPLRPAWNEASPLDMSDCGLRSVSPIHLQYLRNMGVTASASVSIVKDGALWGLVACHHATPRLLTYDVRAACRRLAGSLARQIRAKEEAELYRQRIRLRSFEDSLVKALSQEPSLDEALPTFLQDVCRMLDADGVALLRGGELVTEGVHPSRGEIRDLADWVAGRSRDPVFATSNLEESYPPACLFREHGSGVLALDLAGDEPSLLLWFRAEQVEVIRWAGHPHKEAGSDPNASLTPRASFEAWQETVRGRARRWTLPEIEAAGRLRGLLLEMRQNRRVKELNRHLAETLKEREKLLEQKDFLMGEVNHRVQNSLQLVASFLSMQGRTSSSPELRAALDEAQRRLSAVALVHRRLYSGDQIKMIDAARYVEELCADAIASMGRDWTQFLSLDVAPVLIPADRAVTLGLVLTELLININKYAYGGAPGPIEVRLKEDRDSFQLVVADSGSAKFAPGKPAAGKGFGSRMIAGMVAQLRGTLVHEDNRPGLRAVLTAPLALPEPVLTRRD